MKVLTNNLFVHFAYTHLQAKITGKTKLVGECSAIGMVRVNLCCIRAETFLLFIFLGDGGSCLGWIDGWGSVKLEEGQIGG